MSDHYEKTIAEMQKTLAVQEGEVHKTKEMINRLCEFAGKSPLYSDSDLKPSGQIGVTRSDQFYGKPLARSVRQILEMRDASGAGPATVREIFEGLGEGAYKFETKNDKNAMRGLRVSLSKNIATFHKLPNGQFGLVAWYPNIKQSKIKDPSPSAAEAEAPDTEEDDDDESYLE